MCRANAGELFKRHFKLFWSGPVVGFVPEYIKTAVFRVTDMLTTRPKKVEVVRKLLPKDGLITEQVVKTAVGQVFAIQAGEETGIS
jgi:hypothetical protein